jgi:hypothetical protein
MRSAELRIPANELSHAMDNMRIWLDDHKVGPTTFRYTREADGTVVVALTFVDDTTADAFVSAFDGRSL